MAAKGKLAILAGYFNDKNASNYKPLRDFSAEVRQQFDGFDAELMDLVEGVCAITGDTVRLDPVK
jgi:hypothetical protein